MSITNDVREYAKKKGIEDTKAITQGFREKSAEFREKGSKLYQ